MSVGVELQLVGRRGCGCCRRGMVEMHRVRVSGCTGTSSEVMMMMMHAAGEVHCLLVRWWWRWRQAVRRRKVGRLEVGGRGRSVDGGVTETVGTGHGTEAGRTDIAAELVERTAEVASVLHIQYASRVITTYLHNKKRLRNTVELQLPRRGLVLRLLCL